MLQDDDDDAEALVSALCWYQRALMLAIAANSREESPATSLGVVALVQLLSAHVQRVFKAAASLLELATMLHVGLSKLPATACQHCSQLVLPADVKELEKLRKGAPLYPLAALCGHWLHYKCLDTALTNPPFVKQCVSSFVP